MEIPNINKVCFIHYQCDDFEIGNKIHSLNIFAEGKAEEFKDNEIQNILDFHQRLSQLLSKGLILVHWNMNKPFFSLDAILSRYAELTGQTLSNPTNDEINMSDFLVQKYGQDYIGHPRLDKLAELNDFSGKSNDKNLKTYNTNRLLLITKIYKSTFDESLKTVYTESARKTIEKRNNPLIDSKRLTAPVIIAILKELGVFGVFSRKGFLKGSVVDTLYQIIGTNKKNLESYYDDFVKNGNKSKDEHIKKAKEFLNSKGY